MSKYKDENFGDVAMKVIKDLEHQEELYQKSVRPKMQKTVFILTAASFSLMNFAGHGLSVFKPIYEIVELSDFELLHKERFSFSFIIVMTLYSIWLIFSGQISDKFSIQKIITLWILVMWASNFMISIGNIIEVSNSYYSTIFIAISSLCSSFGWPWYMSLIGNWFPTSKRGLVLGAWTSCWSLGYLLAFVFMAFISQSYEFDLMSLYLTFWLILGILAALNSQLLVENPAEMNIVIEVSKERLNNHIVLMKENNQWDGNDIGNQDKISEESNKSCSRDSIINNSKHDGSKINKRSVPLLKALKIKRVILYSFWSCLIKWSIFSFTGCLLENRNIEFDLLILDNHSIFVVIEFGVILGSIFIGFLSDKLFNKRTPTLFFWLLLCGIICLIYPLISTKRTEIFYIVCFIIGFLSGSSYNLIGSAVAIDIAKDYYETVNHRAISTISGIIYGFGSLGATIGLVVALNINKMKVTHWFIFLGCWLILSSMIIFKCFIEDIKENRRMNYISQTKLEGEVELIS